MQPAPTVLLAEDDCDIRAMMAAVLESVGCAVVTAANGAEAYRIARERRPALILLDLMMPLMSGEEFREAQLADPAIRDIPIIVLSAHHDASRIARRMKATGCLEKPLDFERLETLVRQHCR